MELRHLRYFVAVGFVGLPLEAEDMVTETTGRTRPAIALPEKHPMARKRDLRLEELSKEAYVLWRRHAAIRLRWR